MKARKKEPALTGRQKKFVEAHYPFALSLARRRAGDRAWLLQEYRDVAIDGLIWAARNRDRRTSPYPLALIRKAIEFRFLALGERIREDRLRFTPDLPDPIDPDPEPDLEPEFDLAAMLAPLSKRFRTVLAHRFGHGRTRQETASRMHVPTSEVWQAERLALIQLRSRLANPPH